MTGISKKWKDTMDKATTDPTWDGYDGVIKKEVAYYKSKFATKPALPHVDWLILKAMLWNESGGPSNPHWKARPLQIGNKGDPALKVLLNGKEGSHLVAAPVLIQDLKAGKINDPTVNVRAGLAYLYTRMANFAHESVLDPKDKKRYEYKVVGGDNLSKIAQKVGTTISELTAMNLKAAKMIHPNDVLYYHKASIVMVIKGWRTFDVKTVAKRYNGDGDRFYEAKLIYILKQVMPKIDPKKR